jgi:hypothetical protein
MPLLKYASLNLSLGLTREASNLGMIHWTVDALFAVHPNFKSHTGGSLSLCKGSVIDIL